MNLTNIILYTDGASSIKTRYGGWATVKIEGSRIEVLKGRATDTTNNRMELMAVIEGIESCQDVAIIDVYSDSEYVIKGITQWMIKWKQNNWLNSNFEPVSNLDLWKRLDKIVQKKAGIDWHHVRGHAGDPMNELADFVAVAMKTATPDTIDKITHFLEYFCRSVSR